MTKVVITENQEEKTYKKGFFSLFGKREKIYPARVFGTFRKAKWLIMLILLGLYYLGPWLRWDRGEGLPDQAILVDLPHRTFYFFGLEIWPQEVFLLSTTLLTMALVLFFVTALFGRIWCGYACPQTVWTDLFVMVERALEGNRYLHMKRDKQPFSFDKLWRKVTKHILWIFIALATGGVWVFYFTDVPTFWHNLLQGEIAFVHAFWISFLTCTTYVLAGHAREQVCTYMCPYARFQGAMFDTDTLVVAYDEKRGEPRGRQSEGDCVDCFRCVHVCPVGIDIRDGQQYQCINCGLCIDACNAVMDKVGKLQGLIRYSALSHLSNTSKEDENGLAALRNVSILRPRTLIYFTLITCAISFIIYSLTVGRMWVDVGIQKERNPLYIQLSNGDVRNAYTVRILNKRPEPLTFRFYTNLQQAKLSAPTLKQKEKDVLEIKLKPREVKGFRLLLDMPKDKAKGQKELRFMLKSEGYSDYYDSRFTGVK